MSSAATCGPAKPAQLARPAKVANAKGKGKATKAVAKLAKVAKAKGQGNKILTFTPIDYDNHITIL